MYGGRNQQGTELRELWEWAGTTWNLVSTQSQPPFFYGSFAFDTRRGVAVLGPPQVQGTWEFFDVTPTTGSFQSFGNGCAGSAGVPQLTRVSGTPTVGNDLRLSVGPVPNSPLSRVFGVLGFSTTTWMGLPLPFSLGSIGAPGCSLLVSTEDILPLPVSATSADWTLILPLDRRFVGQEVGLQALILDFGVNAANLVTSDGAVLRVGT